MNKKKLTVGILIGLIVVLLSGALLVVFLGNWGQKEQQASEEIDLTMFSAYTDVDVFQNVPVMVGESIKYGLVEDYGNSHYLADVNGTTVEEYMNYLSTLEKAGFKKHSQSKEGDVEGYVMTSAFTKGDLTLVVAHMVQLDKTYISAKEGLSLSDHLIYNEESVKGIASDAETTLHMLELNDNGNSFVIQLKNGHFIMIDGGIKADAPYLLDYLEELAPGDEKPVIEAWFITHAHGDHNGALNAIATNDKYNSRVIVDGIYYNEPSSATARELKFTESGEALVTTTAYSKFKSQSGETAKYYRPQIGQRYYFCDVELDICFTQEQIPPDTYYSADYNDTSLWMMFYIEGQKVLCAGDANLTGMRKVMYSYDKSYFDVDVFTVLHHGINVYDFFTDFCTAKTALYTSFRMGSVYTDGTWREAKEANIYLQEAVLESYHRGDGTVVLTFPYEVGTANILAPLKWEYNTPAGQPKRTDWDALNK